MNFAAIGIKAIEALNLGQDIAKTIEHADKAIKKANGGCDVSGSVAVAHVKDLVSAHRKYKLQVIALTDVDLCIPVDLSQSIAKVDALLNVGLLITQDALTDNIVRALVQRFAGMRR
ncbi:MAG: hypothetical protein ACRC2Y_05000 [Aeromonas veronii]